MLDAGSSSIGFGIDAQADYTASQIELSIEGARSLILTPFGDFPMKSPIIGRHNVYNILAAAAAANCLGVPEFIIQSGIQGLEGVPGRLEKVSRLGEPFVFVDYAHKDDALQRVLQNLSLFSKGKIITVFGCGGDRDRAKRPLMGATAVRYSDYTIITSDNPRSEDPQGIIDQIEKGIDSNAGRCSPTELAKQAEKAYTIVPNRKTAIGLAISIAGSP